MVRVKVSPGMRVRIRARSMGRAKGTKGPTDYSSRRRDTRPRYTQQTTTHAHTLTVPVGAVVKLDPRAEGEGDCLDVGGGVNGGRPRFSKRGLNGTVGAILGETLVDPVVGEELVWPVAVRVKAANCDGER